MTITEALTILRGAPKEGSSFEVTLACGFTALHLQTFLTAHLQQVLPVRRVIVSHGLFGDLLNTVDKAIERRAGNLTIVIEWSDLDVRLGYRACSKWGTDTAQEAVSFAGIALERLAAAVERASSHSKVVISLPTLPLPPFFHTSGWQLSDSEAELAGLAATFAARTTRSGATVVNQTRLDGVPSQRHDLKSDLLLGLPYTLGHADRLAACIARLLQPAPPKKGIITDLDDTLWSGLVGELGSDGVHWSVDRHSGFHALYQTLLCTLARHGILVGVASKNQLENVEETFRRGDMLLPRDVVFPMEVHWNAKSTSVAKILKTWNIAADAVVFVDDSPMELVEVASAHPGIETIQFNGTDYEAGSAMLERIRDLFGKQTLTSEDSIRLSSIRQSEEFATGATGPAPENFLQNANAIVHFDFSKPKSDSRAFELVNKTNQFNLNGLRYTQSDWESELMRSDTEVIVASYEDRFGLLGKIAVMIGTLNDDTLHLKSWVMSCRAFSRRIEYLCLRTCFERYQLRQIEFDFIATSKNEPLQEFFMSLLGSTLKSPLVLTQSRFEEVCPLLYHKVDGVTGLERDGQHSGKISQVL